MTHQKSFIVLLWLAGFVFSLPLVQPYELARLAAIVCVLLSCVAVLVTARPERLFFPRNFMWLAAGGFWLLWLAAVFWSASPFVSFISFCTFSMMPAAFFAFTARRDAVDLLRPVLMGGCLVIAALAGWAVAQYVFFPQMLVSGQVRFPFASPNSYGALLSLGFFCGLGALHIADSKRNRIFYSIFCALALAAIIIIGGRGALLCLLAAFAVFLWLERGAARAQIISLGLLAAAALAAFLVPGFLDDSLRDSPAERYGDFFLDAHDNFARLDIWMATLKIIAAHPFTGTGPGTFFLFYPEMRAVTEVYSSGLMAHSDPLQFAAEGGVLAVVLFYAVIIAAVVRMVRYYRRGDMMPQRALQTALFCGLGALIVHAHVDYNFYVASILTFSGLVLAAWFAGTEGAKSEAHTVRPVTANVLGAAAVVAVCGTLFALQGFLRSEHYTEKARTAAMSGDMEVFGDFANRANESSFGLNPRPYVLAANVPLALLDAAVSGMMDGDIEGLSLQIEGLLDEAEKHNPRLVAVPYYRAQLRNMQGRAAGREAGPQVETNLKQALRLDPTHLPSRFMLADLYEFNGDTEESWRVLKDGIEWPYMLHDAAPYYRRVMDMAAARGEESVRATAERKLARALMQKMNFYIDGGNRGIPLP